MQLVKLPIVVRGAREHNLQNVSVELPRNRLICFSGVSGSGKSSLAFDTIFAEGQRRYLESLSTYARQFIGQLPKPDVDFLSGLSPSISISQKSTGHNPRSTVGTMTEINDFLRVLFARVGTGFCPTCDCPITAQTRDQIVERILLLPQGPMYLLMAPIVRNQKGEYKDLFEDLRKQGFNRARVDGQVVLLSDPPQLTKQLKHTIEVVVDRLDLATSSRSRIAEAVDTAIRLGEGTLLVVAMNSSNASSQKTQQKPSDESSPETKSPKTRSAKKKTSVSLASSTTDSTDRASTAESLSRERVQEGYQEIVFSAHYACPSCGVSYQAPSPQLLSFNSPQGMCKECNGLGEIYTFDISLLIAEPTKSIRGGAIALFGKWSRLSRWTRQQFEGVATAIESVLELKEKSFLKTPWKNLPVEAQQLFLYGTGEQTIAVTLRGGKNPRRVNLSFSGVVAQLRSAWNGFKNPLMRKQYEKYMHQLPCTSCSGQRLNRQARFVRIQAAVAEPLTKQATQRKSRQINNEPMALATGVDVATVRRTAPEANVQDSGKTTITSGQRKSRTKSLDKSSAAINLIEPSRFLSLPDVGRLQLAEALDFFSNISLTEIQRQIATEALKEICTRLEFLLEVGLGYLSLDRPAPSLSGGESQRIRLASQIGSGLVGVTYVLDEPSIGLHPRDNDRLLNALKRLRDLGNTVLVVEHDEDTMHAADTIVDFGPGPGVRGGRLIAQGDAATISANEESVTGGYISGRLVVPQPTTRRVGNRKTLRVTGATHHNLKNVSVDFPLGCFICVTGVSGSGKSSLVTDIVTPLLRRDLNGAEDTPGAHQDCTGIEHLDKIIDIDQSPIGRTPRSNPATYVKVFDEIRDLYSKLTESKKRGYLPGRFSFNTEGGRCGACEGNGATRLDMEMLADLWVTCPVCNGRRYDHETLQVLFKGKSIADCLEMDIQEALLHFESIPKIAEKLQTLHEVGLDYLKLGQSSPTLSGGEAQRIKLAKELSRRSTGKTLYVLDEPTTGLHFHDIAMLLKVLQSLVDRGNTVIVVEHNLDLIQAADWIIDLGPEGGGGGGEILAEGTPEEIACCKQSHTGRSLAKYFADQKSKQTALAAQLKLAKSEKSKKLKASEKLNEKLNADQQANMLAKLSVQESLPLVVEGAGLHNLQDVNLSLEQGKMTVFCGQSGSGKTSMAFDTIYAEGQRRFVESLSSYARQFVGQMPKPIVRKISGLSPAVALEQRALGHTPRSTVGTVTEIYDYLRVLMARLATMHCPVCKSVVGTQTIDQIVDHVMSLPAKTRVAVLAPLQKSGTTAGRMVDDIYLDYLQGQGFVRVRIDGVTIPIADRPPLIDKGNHEIEIVVDRLEINAKDRSRIAESIESGLDLGKGTVRIAIFSNTRPEPQWEIHTHSLSLSCSSCGLSYSQLSPHSFSFNTQLGWCEDCDGLGVRLGTNPAAFFDASRSLVDGGMLLWPELTQGVAAETSKRMLKAICDTTGIRSDVPIGSMSLKEKNVLLFGTQDQSYQVDGFSFRFRGIYPAMDIAARSSPTLRVRLESYTAEVECRTCNGSRVRPEAAHAKFRDQTIADFVAMPLSNLLSFVNDCKLDERERKIAGELIREVQQRLSFLVEVGLDYLSLGRAANSLSGGESQRIRLAAQLGSGLCGVLYVLDEPTIGLHPRDNHRLVTALHRLRDLGNTLIVVEHDRDVISGSDYLCDFGPGAGYLGGRIVSSGTPKVVGADPASVTGPFISDRKSIPIPSNRREVPMAAGELFDDASYNVQHPMRIGIRGARANTLRSVNLDIPLGVLVAVTGPSGSGKSSLINDQLYPLLARAYHRAHFSSRGNESIKGLPGLSKVIRVDQSPIGSTPSSNPATYTGVFDTIRELFGKLPDAKARGFTARKFSFNVPGGRCEKCEGVGKCKIEMHFLPDVWVECDACHGKRYTSETLSIRYRGKSIYDVLQMTIDQAYELFINLPQTRRILSTLRDVGLGYVSLGQPAPTLSGGEAQRVKLASELARPSTGDTMYLLDEPTTGLHFEDIAKLLKVMHSLVDLGNTVVVIEHNLDVIKSADWVIDMGPEAGWGGGQVVYTGTPEELVAYAVTERKNDEKSIKKRRSAKAETAQNKPMLRSYTGEALAEILSKGPYENREFFNPLAENLPRQGDITIAQLAKESLSPWEIDGRKWHLETSLTRSGATPRWNRTMLRMLIDRIEASEKLGEIAWNANSMIEVPARKKGRGWFLHAFTVEENWLKLKFRIPRSSFTKQKLLETFQLPTLSSLPGLNLVNRDARVTVSVGDDWLELELRPYLRHEIDNETFWSWLDEAIHYFADASF
jgi:excinuclease ABC subunit A